MSTEYSIEAQSKLTVNWLMTGKIRSSWTVSFEVVKRFLTYTMRRYFWPQLKRKTVPHIYNDIASIPKMIIISVATILKAAGQGPYLEIKGWIKNRPGFRLGNGWIYSFSKTLSIRMWFCQTEIKNRTTFYVTSLMRSVPSALQPSTPRWGVFLNDSFNHLHRITKQERKNRCQPSSALTRIYHLP